MKDDIRKAFLNAKPLSKLVTIFGQEVEVRQTTMKRLLAGRSGEDARSMPSDEAFARLLIEICYVPGTNEKVFDDTDVEVLRDLPFGAELMHLQAVVNELTGVDVRAQAKN